jgi:outer membrane protein assembly factor BamA
VAAALLIAVVAAATAPASAAAAAAPVAAVEITARGARDPERVRQVLGVRPGDAYSRHELRRGVQALLASREVEDAVVTVEEGAAGVTVSVRLQMAARVGTVKVEGLSRRLRTRVRAQLALVPGTVLRVPVFEAAVAAAAARLRADGYPDATLQPWLDFDAASETVAVTVAGSLGAPRVLGGVVAEGTDLAGAALLDACGLDRGDRLSDVAVQRARRRLEGRLRREGWWEAAVSPPEVAAGDGGATLRLKVRPGPRYRLELDGVERSGALEDEALPFLAGEEPFSGEPADAALAVRRYLQRRRHLLASASARVDDDASVRVLRVNAHSGPRLHIREVSFPGLTALPAGELEERIGVRRRGLVPWGREPVDDSTLAADGASMLAVLRRRGFAEAAVGTPRITQVGRGFHVELPVVEGPPHTVESVDVAGLPPGFATPALPLAVGGPWSATAAQEAADALAGALRDAAYLDAWVDSSHACTDAHCRVTLTAHPGAVTEVARLVVAGIGRTRPETVLKLARLETPRRLGISEQLEAQRRLLTQGIFQQASLRPIPGQEGGAGQGYVIDVEEALTRSVSYGVGWDSVSRAQLSFSWSHLNLWGSGRSLSVSTDLSSRDTDFEILYRAPRNLGILGLPFWVAIYRDDEDRTDYTVNRRGMWAEVGDRWRKPVRLIPRFDYSIVRSDAPPEYESELEREDQDIAITSITPILEWDTRDDPLVPKRGVYASLQPQIAFETQSTDAEFDKVTLATSAYLPVGRSVLAGALRVGGIHPRSQQTAKSTSPDNLLVPIAVRYFAGGRISNRAFPTDYLGAEGTFADDGSPIGGAGMLLANLELRFPVAGSVGGSVFVDGGNVWPSWVDVNVPDMRWGAGLGVRVETPMGPFRLEYGWKLDRRDGESAGELFFSFGNPF